MNQMNVPAMNAGNPSMAGMPMMNSIHNGTPPRQSSSLEGVNYEHKLNSWIYGYLIEKKQWDVARGLRNSGLIFDPILENPEEEMNGVDEDSKNGITNNKRPTDLPSAKHIQDVQGGSLLLSWFSLFWDMFAAQRHPAEASKAANHLWTQHKSRRDQQMYRPMNGMMPNQLDPKFQQMMRFNGGDLRQQALQNQQQNFRGAVNPQMQIALQRNAMMQQQQQNMRREPSGMDMTGQRPRTPSGGEHAPSPKRARMDGAGFNAQQMMHNGRPQGIPPQMMGDPTTQAQALLIGSGINPANLSETQFASFQHQNPQVQQKSIQVYAQNMSKAQREGMSNVGDMSDGGSPMMADAMNMPPGAEFYTGANGQMLRAGMGPNPGANSAGGNHALQDYQMQLMLLEQQNKKRLLMARQEQEGPGGQQGMAGNFAPGMSPQGSRGGPSPGPGGERRGTPKMGQPGIPGSPLPDGSMRGSPAAMNTFNPMQNEMYAQMNGNGMRPPPSSNPGFNGQLTPQQMEQLRANGQGRMPNGNWPQGPPGQAPMVQQQPQNQQQPAPMGTPQQRNDMPPPQAPGPGAVNGRAGSDENPPTPQPANKSNPKGKKEGKPKKQVKKNSTSVAAATPASEAENPSATPTPSTPITPSHPSSFAQKNEAPQPNTAQPVTNGAAPQVAAPQPDINVPPQFNGNADGTEQGDAFNMPFSDIQNTDLLDTFNFEEFLDQNAWHLDPTPFDGTEMIDPQMGEVP